MLSFFGKPFGNGKKTEPKVVKSIQLAAAAAKKVRATLTSSELSLT